MRPFDRILACGLFLVAAAVGSCGGTKTGSRDAGPAPASARGEGGAAGPSGAGGGGANSTGAAGAGGSAEPSDPSPGVAGAGGDSGAGGGAQAGAGGGGGASAGNGGGGSGASAGNGGDGGSAGGAGGAAPDGGGASDAAPEGEGDAPAASDAGSAPDDASSVPDDAASTDADPPPAACGGVVCPALFALVDSCRPEGMCSLAQQGLAGRLCYENGVKVLAVPDVLGGKQILTWTKSDGLTPCYSVETPLSAPGGVRSFVWRTPAGAVVATGQMGPGGQSQITCGGVTAPLLDETCVSIPSPADCTPGACP